MIRIFAFLMICTLIYSCTNTETNTVKETEPVSEIVEDQSEESSVAVEESQQPENNSTAAAKEEIEAPTEQVQKIEPAKVQPTEKTVAKASAKNTNRPTPSAYQSYSSNNIIAVGTVAVNTVFMTEEEVAKFNETDNDLVNVAQVKQQFQLPSADDVAALRDLFDDLVDEVEGFASMEDTTAEKTVRTGAFDEVISITKSGEDITDEVIFKEANSINKESLEYIRRPKPLVEYSGYKIELMTVFNKSLDLNDPLFKTFGGLLFKNNTMNSTTYYLGDFDDTKALEDYLQKVVKTRFPKAKGVKFENGIEVKYN